MKKIILGILFSAFAISSYAIDSDSVRQSGWSNLSAEQQADILKQIAAKAHETSPSSPAPSTAKEVDEWVAVGDHLGAALSGAAKQVGIAVNEFVQTPVGKWTMVIIVWQFLGHAIVHVVGAVGILLVGWLFLRALMNRSVSWEYTYDKEKKDVFGRPIAIKKERSSFSEDEKVGYTVAHGAVLMVALLVMLTF